ncbi:MAG: acetate--CoA ligase family protein [Desulfotomaculaceae bacterium]
MSTKNMSYPDLDALFYPGSIAVIGASEDHRKPGGIVLDSLKAGGFNGAIYPINPKYQELGAWSCFPNIDSVPGPVDLVIITVKTPLVLTALEACGSRGVKAAIVFSAGFGETDESGSALQHQLKKVANRYGVRLCGPNTMGIINYMHHMRANFVLGDILPSWDGTVHFGIALISQSGGVGCRMLAACAGHGLDVSAYVCTGNEAVTDFADYLVYLVHNPGVKIIAAYMEGVRDGEKLGQAIDLARAAGKPVVIMKTGGSEISARAAHSHTGSLAGSAVVYSSFFQQQGVIEVQNIRDMMGVISLLATGRRPDGGRVAIIASSGGYAVMAADKCAGTGLEVVELGAETSRQMAEYLPGYATSVNPVDFTGVDIVTPGLFRQCAAITAVDPSVDVLLLLNWFNEEVDPVGQLLGLAKDTDKPMVWAGLIPDYVTPEVVSKIVTSGIAFIDDFETGIRALASVARYEQKVKHQASVLLTSEAPPELVAGFRSLKEGTLLGEREVKELLGAYGIPSVAEVAAATAQEAVQAAARLGYPVVLKIDSPDIAHKTEVSGVRLNLTDPDQVRRAFADVTEGASKHCPGAVIRGVLVQNMLQGGLEVLVGLSRDPVFGLTLTFGLGGIWVETLRDVSLRLLPVSEDDIRDMIREIKAYPLLAGARGSAPYDLDALVRVMRGVARLGMDWPQLAELDINPIYLMPQGQGAYAVDAMAVV